MRIFLDFRDILVYFSELMSFVEGAYFKVNEITGSINSLTMTVGKKTIRIDHHMDHFQYTHDFCASKPTSKMYKNQLSLLKVCRRLYENLTSRSIHIAATC